MQSITDTGTSDGTGGSGTTFESDGHGLSAADLLYIGSTTVFEPGSMFTIVASQVTNTITLPVAAVNSLGVETTYDAQDWAAGTRSTTAVATFYIPFSGEKAFSYFTNTGRAAELKVPATRWRASDTDGSKVLIGNVDTTDENDQSQRERGRVYESPDGMPDTFLLTRSKDVGIHQGDQIKAIKHFGGNWWVMMERNVVVLEPGSLTEVERFNKVGLKWETAFAATKHGLAIADENKITLLPSGEELTFPKRDSYQSLSFLGSTMGYSIKQDELYFIGKTGLLNQELWVFSFRNNSWRRETIPTVTAATGRVYTNIVSNLLHNEPEVIYVTPITFTAIAYQFNSEADSSTGEIKTKEYHLGKPYEFKGIRNGYLSYRSTSQTVIVEAFLNGSTTAHYSKDFAASSSMTNIQIGFKIEFKLVSFRFTSTATDFEIEEFIVPDEEITFLDRR